MVNYDSPELSEIGEFSVPQYESDEEAGSDD